MHKTLIDAWTAYQDGDYLTCLNTSVQGIVDHAGIDLLHLAGLAMMAMRRYREGIPLLNAAVTMRPHAVHIYNNAVYAAEQAGLIDEVAHFITCGLMEFPDDVDLLLARANNLANQKRFDQAYVIYQDILKQNPHHVMTLINLANFHRAKDEFDQAESLFATALALDPGNLDAIYSRAIMFTQMGENDRAIALLEQVTQTIEVRYLLSLLYLARGDYERGFRLFRVRSQLPWYRTGNYVGLKPFDHWNEARGKRVAVIPDGGFGDIIQFARYFPQLAEVAELTVIVPKTLVRLLRYNLPDTIAVKAAYESTMEFDYITTDGEMPYHFRTTIDNVPPSLPITVPVDAMLPWALGETTATRVGICWAGGPRDNMNNHTYDERRSLTLEHLAPLADIPGVEFVSLQHGSKGDEEGLPLLRIMDDRFDFMDTAAIIAQLDLVISVDTSVVHLAAAMGKPTWVLSRYDSCWRWLRNRPDSVWYPGVVKVFGQEQYRDWSRPLAQVKQALQELVGR